MAFEIIHTDEHVITLRDAGSGTEAEIYAFGALLNAFRVATNNGFMNVVEGFASVSDARKHITNGFRSAKLSPFVCRMRGGRYSFDHRHYHVAKYYLGEHAIHGLLFDLPFEILSTHADEQHAAVRLALNYMGDDEGYPFPFHMEIEWKLETGNRLTVSTQVIHQNPHPIPYADGWHPYFTLGGNADEWTLQFNSNKQLEFNAELVPTGHLLHDARFESRTLLAGIELDNSFVLDKNGVCSLSNEHLRLQIRPDASYPILQVYIPPHRKSIAIENLSGPPDNFNNGMNLLLLQPNEKTTFVTSYTLEIL